MELDSKEFLNGRDVIFEGQGSVKSLSKSASGLLLEYSGEFFVLI